MNKITKIAVLSDTHIPDRIPELPMSLLNRLRQESPDLLLHAGDISVPRVLDELARIAPVKAVRGNRDLLLAGRVPMNQHFVINGVRFALMHGHINPVTYWWDKIVYLTQGYALDRYISRLPRVIPDADFYIYGHTHHAEDVAVNGKRFFNPGSVSYGDVLTRQRTWGLLEVDPDGQVTARIMRIET